MFDSILFGFATFLDCCVRNELSTAQYDDFVEAWHNSVCNRPIIECIGSREAYIRMASENCIDVLNEYVERASRHTDYM